MSFELRPPVYFQGNRARYTIPMSEYVLYDTDWMLSNVGSWVSANGNLANFAIKYPARSGIYSSIKTATLSLNNREVEVVEDVGELASINNLGQLNSMSYSVSSQLLRTRNTFKWEAGKIAFKDNINNVSPVGVDSFNTLTADASTTPTGVISLSTLFGSLQAMMSATPKVLILSKYVSVTLDFEFETDPLKFNITGTDITNGNVAGIQAMRLSPTPPMLILKKYIAPALLSEYNDLYLQGMNIQYVQWAKDEAIIPKPAAANGVTALEFRLKNMLNRSVTSMIIQNKYEYSSTTAYTAPGNPIGLVAWNAYCNNINGKQYSVPNTAEVLQLKINDKLLFPGVGINSAGLKAMYRDKVMDHMQLLPLADYPVTDAVARKYMEEDVIDSNKIQSFYGILLNMRPTDFVVNYSKQAAATDFLNTQGVGIGLDQKMITRFKYQRTLQIKTNNILLGNV